MRLLVIVVDVSLYHIHFVSCFVQNITGHKTPARPTRSSLRTHVNSPCATSSTLTKNAVPSVVSAAVSAAAHTEHVVRVLSPFAAPAKPTTSSPAIATESKCLPAAAELPALTDNAVFESINATQSDEDIAVVCGRVEEEQVIMSKMLIVLIHGLSSFSLH
jgi:hypothetical protein